ncbi:hypothetical protein [Lacrimispora sp.]|uniref:hypothetical protein n=1 Tax=Lacrimispora sp. TaxID=2719234 RepID=UPI0028A0C9B9|nr:hypothetical protein [Lacrimispora sp.]
MKLRSKYWLTKLYCLIYDTKRALYALSGIIALISVVRYIFGIETTCNLICMLFITTIFALWATFGFVNVGSCLVLIRERKRLVLTMKSQNLQKYSEKKIFEMFLGSFKLLFGTTVLHRTHNTLVYVHTHETLARGMIKLLYQKHGVNFTKEQWKNEVLCNGKIYLHDREIIITQKMGKNFMSANKYSFITTKENMESVFEKIDYYDIYIPITLLF